MFGFGLQAKLENAEVALRAALAERDEYLRQRDIALGERNEFLRQRDQLLSELEQLKRGQSLGHNRLELHWTASLPTQRAM